MGRRDDTPRDLLFGLLALQTGLIDQEQLLGAFGAWSRDRGKALAEILVDRGAVDAEGRAILDAMAGKQLKIHGGDAEKSLASIAVAPAIRDRLGTLGGPDLTASLGHASRPSAPTEPAPDASATITVGASTGDGGRFRVLRPHARGGLGTVYVALDGELNREVALKQILDHHADDPLSRTRFLIEAEITGGLEHPGIVPVYGLGTYGDGRPYYAMRFIRGDSLKEAIAAFHEDDSLKTDPGKRSLALRKLLRRFVDVCNAIDYAHGRGVLHRDIKPSNIIVGKHGETLVVDWGLAKPMGERAVADANLGERTLVPSSASGSAETLPGSALGTPAYMSPEQAAGDLEHLGPRSDVYSLGATLYALLTGRAPFEGDDVGAILRDVQKGQFPKPRQVDPAFDPALEAVCLKAMALRPEDRHASARALADDVERWSADEPVSAYRDPIPIRLARWGRRHRTVVAIAAGLLQTAVIVLVVATILIGQSRARVDRERRLAANARDRAEAINRFLVDDLLAQADPTRNKVGDQVTVRELLDRAAVAVDANSSLVGHPEVEAAIRSAIGQTYHQLTLYDLARPQLEKAHALGQFPADVSPAERIKTWNRLNLTRYRQGEYDRIHSQMDDAWLQANELLGPDHDETLYAASNLAALELTQMRFDNAIPLYRKILETERRRRGEKDKFTIRASFNLGCALLNQYDVKANPAEAEALLRSSYETALGVFGPDHPDTLYPQISLGLAMSRQGRFEEARAWLAPLEARVGRVFGPDHVALGELNEILGLAEEGLGHLDAARDRLTKALAIRRLAMRDSQPFVRRNLAYLARVDLEQGRTADAAARFLVDPSWFPSVPLADLEAALRPKGDPKSDPGLLRKLENQLRIQLGRDDWLTCHVAILGDGQPFIQYGVPEAQKRPELRLAAMEANPRTPPEYLAEARARVAARKDPRPGSP